MTQILAIAHNTFREATRSRVFYSIAFFAVVLIMTSFLFTELTSVLYDRILRDMGFAALSGFGVLLTIFLGVSVINREIDRRTVYTVLTKPVRRSTFLLGKYLGVLAAVVSTLTFMMICFLVVQAFMRAPMAPVVFAAFALLLVEVAVLLAFAVLTSAFTTSMLSALFCGGLFLIGHTSGDLVMFSGRSDLPIVRAFGRFIHAALPDLERFNLKLELAYLLPVDAGRFALAVLHGALWVGAFLTIATVVFARRDFK